MKNLAKKRTANLAAKPGEGFAVDASAGIIRNVALLTVGEALGYWWTIDATTLETALAAIKQRGGKLRIYPTHAHSGCTHGSYDETDEVGSELNYAAFADGISIKGAQLVAASLQFYDTFRKNYEPVYDNIMELAAKTPDLLGLSIEPVYHCAYVGKDGVEYSAKPEGVDLVTELPAMRVDEIYAAAFGAVPAANPGLFAQLSAKFGGKRMAKLVKRIAAELRDDITAVADLHAAAESPAYRAAYERDRAAAADLAAKKTTAANAVQSASPNKDHSESSDLRTMKLIADLKAKFTDPTRFAAAMSIVGNTPADKLAGLSVGEVEQQLVVVDLTAANNQVTKLTTDLTAANGKVTDLTKQVGDLTVERDTLKQQIADLKKSGLPNAVDLGAASSGAANIGDENPFLTGNLTAQAKLTKADPTRANALKEAAKTAKAAAAAKK